MDRSDVYESATVTLGGVPLSGARVSVARAFDESSSEPERRLFEPRTYTATATMTLEGPEAEALALVLRIAFAPDWLAYRESYPGASLGTLQRRVRYGGRKGRSALARLRLADRVLRSLASWRAAHRGRSLLA